MAAIIRYGMVGGGRIFPGQGPPHQGQQVLSAE